MSKKNPKPETPAAKGEAALLADCRKNYAEFDAEVVRFGLLVAVYNAGWLTGHKHVEQRRAKARARRK